MIKRVLVPFAGAAVLLLGLSACGEDAGGVDGVSLYGQGLEIIQLMSEMIQSEEYVGLYVESSEVKAVVQAADGDYSEPETVYAVSVLEENLDAGVDFMMGLGGLDGISDELRAFLAQRVFDSLPTQINSKGGAEVLAAAGICTAGKTFVSKDAEKDVIYLYTYEDAPPVAVVFLVGEDQAVSARGCFILYDGFACGSAEETKASFGGTLAVEVREVFEK